MRGLSREDRLVLRLGLVWHAHLRVEISQLDAQVVSPWVETPRQPLSLHAAVPSERAPGSRCAADPRHPAPASARSRHRRLLSRGRRDGHGVLERWGGRDQTPPRFEDPLDLADHDAEPGEVFMPPDGDLPARPLSRSGSPGESRHWHRTGPRGSGPGTRQGSGCPRHGPGFARSYRFCASSHRCPPHKDPDLEEQLKCQSNRAWAHGTPSHGGKADIANALKHRQFRGSVGTGPDRKEHQEMP